VQQSGRVQCQINTERAWFEQHPEPRATESSNRLLLWNFPINDSIVQSSHREVLRQFLARHSLHFFARGARVEVTGHASESGRSDLNDVLSHERASVVASIIHEFQPQASIQHHGLGIIGGSNPEVMARNRNAEIILPPHRRQVVPERDSKWNQARSMLEERLGATVGGNADQMWTPTTSAITRMMPAIPLFDRNPRILE